MMNLSELGIAIGQTVTAEMIEKATAAGIPSAALVELWPRRTINKQAMQAIEAAIKAPRSKAKKEPVKDDGIKKESE